MFQCSGKWASHCYKVYESRYRDFLLQRFNALESEQVIVTYLKETINLRASGVSMLWKVSKSLLHRGLSQLAAPFFAFQCSGKWASHCYQKKILKKDLKRMIVSILWKVSKSLLPRKIFSWRFGKNDCFNALESEQVIVTHQSKNIWTRNVLCFNALESEQVIVTPF